LAVDFRADGFLADDFLAEDFLAVDFLAVGFLAVDLVAVLRGALLEREAADAVAGAFSRSRTRLRSASRSSRVATPAARSCRRTSDCTSSVMRSLLRRDHSMRLPARRLTWSEPCPWSRDRAMSRAREGLNDPSPASTYLRMSSSIASPP